MLIHLTEPFACNELYWWGLRWQALWSSQVILFTVYIRLDISMLGLLFPWAINQQDSSLYFISYTGSGGNALWNCIHNILVGITLKLLIVHWSSAMCLLITLLILCPTSLKLRLHIMTTQIARWLSTPVLWRYRQLFLFLLAMFWIVYTEPSIY